MHAMPLQVPAKKRRPAATLARHKRSMEGHEVRPPAFPALCCSVPMAGLALLLA